MSGQTQPDARTSMDPTTPVDGVAFTGAADVEYDLPIQYMIPDAAGTVKVKTLKGNDLTINVIAGMSYKLRIVKVYNVGTTVSGVFLY